MSLIASFVALSLLAAAADRPEAIFKSAIEDFEFGEHYQASEKLRSILEPPKLSSREDLIVARQYLGACYHLLGDKMKAKQQFTMLLALDQKHKLDPEVFSPALVEFFEEVRREVGIEAVHEPEREDPPPKREDRENRENRENKNAAEVTVEKPLPEVKSKPPIALAFIPFGVGQFSNRQPVKGAMFAVGEVGLFATAAISYAMLGGLKLDNSLCPPSGLCVAEDDRGKASTLQTLYLTTFWSGVGLAAIGVIEALISYPGDAP